MRPIQVGFAILDSDGTLQGVWSFNLQFDAASDLCTDVAVNFLLSAGVDLPRHALEGINPRVFGFRISSSTMFKRSSATHRLWVAFSGSYDFAYLLKLLTAKPLPQEPDAFDAALAAF